MISQNESHYEGWEDEKKIYNRDLWGGTIFSPLAFICQGHSFVVFILKLYKTPGIKEAKIVDTNESIRQGYTRKWNSYFSPYLCRCRYIQSLW